MITLPIIYQDEHLVAINKPSGLMVHRSNIDATATEFALQILRDQIGQKVYPIHRLDRPTSGVLLFALAPEVAADVCTQFEQHTVQKVYWAVVRGFPPSEGVIDYPLSFRADTRQERRKVKKHGKPATVQSALTKFRTLETIELPYQVDKYPSSRYALVELLPKTGRKHQLRRHMKHISHPIIGDPKHGKSRHNQLFAQQYQCARLLLAARYLRFTHPITEQEVLLDAPLDGEFDRLLKQFNWEGKTVKPFDESPS